MVSTLLSERAALDEMEPRWRKLGYTLVRGPSPDQLPAFLRGFQPDAIAIGATPSLVIEVLQPRRESAVTKVKQLQSLFRGHKDWRLEVVYVSSDGAPLQAVTSQNIREALRQARLLAESEPRAGLLMAWATLEAIGRILEPNLASRSLSPRSLVDLLISNGHLPQSKSAKLRRLGDTRNALAHGQINRSPSPVDVRYLIKLGEGLVP
jgi:hypothetical protein